VAEGMEDSVPVYVAGRGVMITRGSSVLDAVRLASPEQAAAIESGELMLTDSRGLPVEPGTAAYAGAILRVVRRKPGGASASDG
jgi:hypothetical protein